MVMRTVRPAKPDLIYWSSLAFIQHVQLLHHVQQVAGQDQGDHQGREGKAVGQVAGHDGHQLSVGGSRQGEVWYTLLCS